MIFSRDGSVWVASGAPRVRRSPEAYVCREAGGCYDSHMWRGGRRWKPNCLGFVCLRWRALAIAWVIGVALSVRAPLDVLAGAVRELS